MKNVNTESSLVEWPQPIHGLDEGLLVGFIRSVPGDSVLEAAGNGDVPDHDAQKVVLDDGVHQGVHGGLACLTLGSKNDDVRGGATGLRKALPPTRPIHVVLDVVQGRGALVHHQANGVCQTAGHAVRIP